MERYFEYENLVGQNIIRVLDLYPASYSADLVSCSLRAVDLSDQPSYEALSYCWGDPTFNKQIICNGKELSITTSLNDALLRFRGRSAVKTLWADAICINQQDIDERNKQVQLMRQIYEKANKVIIWLGEEADHSHLGMALIPKLVEAEKKRDATADRREIFELQRSGGLKDYDLPGRFDNAWRGFFAILQRPWFRRGWIIQEAILASSVTVHCGRAVVTFNDLMGAWLAAGNIGLTEEYDTFCNLALVSIALTRQALSNGNRLGLLSLLLRHRLAQTTDPRDKIFALCGIAADAGPDILDIQIDYHLPNIDVQRNVAIAMMTKRRSLDILSTPKDVDSLDFPSWVPDFSLPVMTSSLISVEYNYQHSSPYRSARSSECSPSFSADGRFLMLSGYMLDVIAEVAEYQPMELGNNDAFKPIESLKDAFHERVRYINWQHMAGVSRWKKYVTGEEMEDAYWQTLTAGYNPGRGMLSDKQTMKAQYLAWKRHSLKHAYLRRLPSPLFEYALAFTMILSGCWIVLRLFLCRPFVPAPSDFKKISSHSGNRRLLKTEKSYIGLAGMMVRKGDLIILCRGGKLPLAVRRENEDCFKLIGDCYVHGVMAGEAFREQDCGEIWLC